MSALPHSLSLSRADGPVGRGEWKLFCPPPGPVPIAPLMGEQTGWRGNKAALLNEGG